MAPADPAHKPECPSCGWFLATEALPVVLVLASTATGKILYTRQRGWPEGAWGLVSGYVEVGETAEQASLREVQEESGLTARSPRMVRTLPYGDLLLICLNVSVEDIPPCAGSDVEAVTLRLPDLDLTPDGWPARAFIEDQLDILSS